MIWSLSVAVFISGILAIWFGYRQPQGGFYLFKPLTMILIILIPLLGAGDYSLQRTLILGGLVFSLVGDVFLMLPADRFLEGLVSFLIAHLFYIAGFLIDQAALTWWPALPVIILAFAVNRYLKTGLGKLKVPASLYMGLISLTVWIACSRWIGAGGVAHLLAFIGAVLFMVSDLILAVNRFRVVLKSARALNLLTYYTGQWLIALSVINLIELG